MSNQRERVKVVRPDGGYTWITRQAAESRAVRNLNIRIEEDILEEVPDLSNFGGSHYASDTVAEPVGEASEPVAKKRGRPSKSQ